MSTSILKTFKIGGKRYGWFFYRINKGDELKVQLVVQLCLNITESVLTQCELHSKRVRHIQSLWIRIIL